MVIQLGNVIKHLLILITATTLLTLTFQNYSEAGSTKEAETSIQGSEGLEKCLKVQPSQASYRETSHEGEQYQY